MNKLMIIALMAMAGMNSFAQGPEDKQQRERLNAGQIAELQTKKMTLHLELNEKQQAQVLEINKKNASRQLQKREERKELWIEKSKLSTDELVDRKSAALDWQIAHQREMKQVLNPEQYENWKLVRMRKAHAIKKRKMQRRMQMRKRMVRKKMMRR